MAIQAGPFATLITREWFLYTVGEFVDYQVLFPQSFVIVARARKERVFFYIRPMVGRGRAVHTLKRSPIHA